MGIPRSVSDRRQVFGSGSVSLLEIVIKNIFIKFKIKIFSFSCTQEVPEVADKRAQFIVSEK